jgi:outer membrane protein TolC
LNATGGWESGSVSRWFSAPTLFWSLGVALAQTIFDGGARIAGKEQAVALYDGSVASYRETVLEAFQDVEDNLAAERLLSQESEEQARAVAAAERALTLAQNRYQGGITSYLEVVTAQTTALANERTAVDLQTRRLTASLNLIKALGGGWSDTQLPEPGAVLAKVTAAASP